MPYRTKKTLVFSDDEILMDFIEKIISLYDECQTEYLPSFDFNNLDILDNIGYVIIDERKNVKNLLSLNQKIKKNYPEIILMIVTDYLDREFDTQFINSGVDFVIPTNKLNENLSKICEKNCVSV